MAVEIWTDIEGRGRKGGRKEGRKEEGKKEGRWGGGRDRGTEGGPGDRQALHFMYCHFLDYVPLWYSGKAH